MSHSAVRQTDLSQEFKKIIIPIHFNFNLLEPTTAKLIDFGDDEAIPEVVQKTKAKGKRMNVIYAKN